MAQKKKRTEINYVSDMWDNLTKTQTTKIRTFAFFTSTIYNIIYSPSKQQALQWAIEKYSRSQHQQPSSPPGGHLFPHPNSPWP